MKELKKIIDNIHKVKSFLDKKAVIYIVFSCLLLAFISICIPFSSIFYKMIIDSLSKDLSIIIILVVGYILVQLGTDTFQHMKAYIDTKIQYNLNNHVIKSISKKMEKIQLEELEKSETFDYIDRVVAKVASSAISFVNTFIDILSPLIITITYALILANVKWYFLIIIFLSSVPYLLLIWKKLKGVYT